MNSACSTCLESFTSASDMSSIPCGHVFHTFCIENWINNGRNRCSQCRRNCSKAQITKLYFSEATSENNLVKDLQEEILKLKEDANKYQGQVLKLEEDKLKYREETILLTKANLKLKQENLGWKEKDVRLNKHINSLTAKWNEEKKILKAQISSSDFNPELPGTSTGSNPELPARPPSQPRSTNGNIQHPMRARSEQRLSPAFKCAVCQSMFVEIENLETHINDNHSDAMEEGSD